MTIVRSPVRSVVRSPVRSVLGSAFDRRGAELVQNGTFDSDISGWVQQQGSIEWSAGQLKCNGATFSNSTARQEITGLEIGAEYEISFDVDDAANSQVFYGTIANGTQYGIQSVSTGANSVTISAFTTNIHLHYRGTSADRLFDNISVKKVI